MPTNLTLGGAVENGCGCFRASAAPSCFDELEFPLGLPNRGITMYLSDARNGVVAVPLSTDLAGLLIVPFSAFPPGWLGGADKTIEVWFTVLGDSITNRIMLTNGTLPFSCVTLLFTLCAAEVYGRITFSVYVANAAYFPPVGLVSQILTSSSNVAADAEVVIFNNVGNSAIATLPTTASGGLYAGRVIYFKDVVGATAVDFQRIDPGANLIDTIDAFVDMSLVPLDREGRILVYSAAYGWLSF